MTTTVLPAWKLELIEKKRKKERNQKQQLETESARIESIPEWKRSLIEKKKELPEAGEQTPSCVNTIFGPRIVKRISQTSLSISNTKQEPGDDENNKQTIFRDTGFRSSYVLSTGTVERNSSVVKAVGFQTEVDHKPGNKHLSHRAIGNSREYNQQVEATEVRTERNVIEKNCEPETAVSYEHVKSPSDLRRMFEKSRSETVKPFSKLQLQKTAESNYVQVDTRTEASFPLVDKKIQNDLQSTQSLSKSVGDNAQSVRADNSFNTNTQLSEPKLKQSPSPLVHSPYKTFVSTPPWLRNTTPRNVAFQVSKTNSPQKEGVVQEGVVEGANVENGVKSGGIQIDVTLLKSVQTSESTVDTNVTQGSQLQKAAPQSCLVVSESGPKEEEAMTAQGKSGLTSVVEPYNLEKAVTLIDNDMELVSDISESNSTECIEAKSNDFHNNQCLVEANVSERSRLHRKPEQKYSLLSECDKVDEELVKPKDGGNLKNAVTDRNNEEECIPAHENEVASPSSSPSWNPAGPIAPDVSPELVSQHQKVEENSSLPQGSVGSLRSKFGPSGGFHKRWSSEENLLKGIPGMVDHVSRRQTHGRRPPPPMKRWSADVINLMSRDRDDDDDDEVSSLSPQSDLKNRSHNRRRSSSLCEVSEEPGLDYFKHKSGVSQGIEHRMNRLIRKASVLEMNLKSEDAEESESLSDDDLPFDNAGGIPERSEVATGAPAVANCEPVATSAHETATEVQVAKEVFVRKRSISSNIEHRVSELLHRQISLQSEEGENITDFDTNETRLKEKDDSIELSLNSDMAATQDKQKDDFKTSQGLIHSTIDDTRDSDERLPDSKPLKGSVHKLSALFGVSIQRTSKKEKASAEVHSKDKISLDIQTQNGTATERDNCHISKLFTSKSEKKSNHVDKFKRQTNVNIFPWLKKHNKEKESSDNERARNIHKVKDENSNFSIEGNDNFLLAARNLRPVLKTGYVEQKLVGNVVLISQGNSSQRQPPPRGVYPKSKLNILTLESDSSVKSDGATVVEREKAPREPAKFDENSKKESGPRIPTVVTQNWNGDKERREVCGEGTLIEDVPVTSIDEVPVSAIDIPESGENDVTVSVIDVPPSPDVHRAFFNGSTTGNPLEKDDVNVSVIDMPSPSNEEKPYNFEAGHQKSNEMSDKSDYYTTEESYGGVHSLVNGIGEDSSDGDEEEDEEEDENDDEDEDENEDEDEDEDEDVPISYIGALPHYPVPQVVFDSEPVQLKSCMSPKTAIKKLNAKVSFKATHVVHDYLSEESVAILHDEMKTKNVELKTLQNYQPAGLVSMEEMIGQFGKQNIIKPHVSNDDVEKDEFANQNPELNYSDDGQAFTDSTDHASALLF